MNRILNPFYKYKFSKFFFAVVLLFTSIALMAAAPRLVNAAHWQPKGRGFDPISSPAV